MAAASAWFDITDSEFTRRYIHSGMLKIDRLHQLSMRAVVKLAEDRGVKRARATELRYV